MEFLGLTRVRFLPFSFCRCWEHDIRTGGWETTETRQRGAYKKASSTSETHTQAPGGVSIFLHTSSFLRFLLHTPTLPSAHRDIWPRDQECGIYTTSGIYDLPTSFLPWSIFSLDEFPSIFHDTTHGYRRSIPKVKQIILAFYYY